MGKGGVEDKDLGFKDISRELKKLGQSVVKIGILAGDGSKGASGESVVEYAAKNEFGVVGKNGKWKIPPRPFMKGWVESNEQKINAVMQNVVKNVSGGGTSAEKGLKKIGVFGKSGVQGYISSGSFTPNAQSTIKRKGSSKPLIDTGTMRKSVNYEVVKK